MIYNYSLQAGKGQCLFFLTPEILQDILKSATVMEEAVEIRDFVQ